MIKHVGRHNNRKVSIVFKQVPDEDHMALIMYSDSLPQMLHDEVMKVLESAPGQQAKDLGDALFRHILPDGNNCLTAIHKGNFMKKVPTSQVIVTVNASSSCRLDELNDILRQMDSGAEATKKLQELDDNRGMRDTTKARPGRELGEPAKPAPASVNTSSSDVLSDADIANQRVEQANRMEAEAKSLLAEAKRLKDEAKSLAPAKAVKKATNVRKTTTTKKTAA